MKHLLVSACLLGVNCKYSGGNNGLSGDALRALRERYVLVPVCPELSGGLPVPRDPSERVGERVMSCRGADVTAQFRKGADTAAALAERFGCDAALLKEQSPSCGSGIIYDGSFTGALTAGYGLAAAALTAAGVAVYGESEIHTLLK